MRYLIYFLIVFLPLQIALNPTEGVDLASIRVLIVFVFLLWLFWGLVKKSLSFTSGPITFGLLLWLFLAAASLFFSEEIGWGLRKFFYFCSISPLYFLISDQKINLRADKIIKILCLAAVFIALIALVQFGLQFFIDKSFFINFWARKIGPIFYGQSLGALVAQNPSWLVEIGGRPFLRAIAVFPDPHMLSFYLGMILPFSLASLLIGRHRKFIFFAFFILLAALFLTFSRGGYLGLLVSFLITLFYVWKYLAQSQKKQLIIFGFLIILVFIIFARPVIGRFLSIFDWQEGSNAARFKIWQESLEIWRAHPWFGVGLGNFPAWVSWSSPYRSAITSHNLYLDILGETGIFSFLTWLSLFLGTIFWLGYKLKDALPQGRVLMAGLIGSLVYFSVHSFFETAIFNPVILALLMVIFGLSVRVCKTPASVEKSKEVLNPNIFSQRLIRLWRKILNNIQCPNFPNSKHCHFDRAEGEWRNLKRW